MKAMMRGALSLPLAAVVAGVVMIGGGDVASMTKKSSIRPTRDQRAHVRPTIDQRRVERFAARDRVKVDASSGPPLRDAAVWTGAGPTMRTVAPGVTVHSGVVPGPNRVHVVTLDPTAGATLDIATARSSLPGTAPTSDIAQREHAILAVNGDYGLFPSRPGHAMAVDGELLQTSPLGTTNGKGFALRADGTASYLGRPRIQISVDRASGPSFAVKRWNDGEPRHHNISGYSTFGGELEAPARDTCAAALGPSGPAAWGPDQVSVDRVYVVRARRCGGDPPAVGDGIVLASEMKGMGANRIRSLVPGESVTLSWTMGWPGVTDFIGGSPVLVQGGDVVVEDCDSYLCGRQPRTAIGITAEGRILLVVIDGRWPGRSEGMTLLQEATLLKALGARWALNLDGGGSSTLWTQEDGILNHPSDGDERSVSSAVLILPGRDRAEPVLAERPLPEPSPSA